jgi:hypothetical protein
MGNPAGNKSLGVLVTSSNFHDFLSFSVSAANPLFKSLGGHPWKSMERAWRLRGSNPLGSILRPIKAKSILVLSLDEPSSFPHHSHSFFCFFAHPQQAFLAD